MGFVVYQIESLEEGRFGLRYLRPLMLSGVNGLFARHLPTIGADKEKWQLSAQDLLRLETGEEGGSERIMFDLSPKNSARLDLFELISAEGRTASILTDVLFHFKVACAGLKSQYQCGPEGEVILPSWQGRPDRYEQLRLDGGLRGGTWAWSEPPQSMTATIL